MKEKVIFVFGCRENPRSSNTMKVLDNELNPNTMKVLDNELKNHPIHELVILHIYISLQCAIHHI